MEDFRDIKADLSELPLQHTAPSSKWRRQGNAVVKAIIVTILFAFGSVVLFHLIDPSSRVKWSWTWSMEEEMESKTSKDQSQYLLGVGKADITGCTQLFLLYKLCANNDTDR